MRRRRFFEMILPVLTFLQMSNSWSQSLVDAARKEAERRKALERQGIEGKVISGGASRVTEQPTEAPVPASRAVSSPARSSRELNTIRTLRAKLQKLDLAIQHGEERLTILRARMESEKWQLPKVGRISRASAGNTARERLGSQIRELEAKLRNWRRERSQAYESGRKAGFLPGELDGKGIVP